MDKSSIDEKGGIDIEKDGFFKPLTAQIIEFQEPNSKICMAYLALAVKEWGWYEVIAKKERFGEFFGSLLCSEIHTGIKKVFLFIFADYMVFQI